MTAYYNEFDEKAAAWLRELIKQGHIAAGDVDTRSIEDVNPDDLRNYTQCHFFAGIGVWSYALRRAGWPDDRPVWTGSCPCQPFSAAGKAGGFADERHLWPAFHHLIRQCVPPTVFGEQVASKDGLAWLDLVQADMEGTGYAFGALDLCAAGFGAPHIRQRLCFVANPTKSRLPGQCGSREERTAEYSPISVVLGDTFSEGLEEQQRIGGLPCEAPDGSKGEAVVGTDAPACANLLEHTPREQMGLPGCARESGRPAATNGFWHPADWLPCIDGKARPVEPGTFPLAHGATARVGRLRAYGNAIVAPVAEAFIRAYLERSALEDLF